MLVTDPWGIGTGSGTRMEVFVRLRREMRPDYIVWDEITSDFEDIQYLNLTQETIWNAARVREMARPLTPVEDRRIKEGIPRETVVKESFWRMRPDGIAVLPPVADTTGIFYFGT
jgi:hypothetical protein